MARLEKISLLLTDLQVKYTDESFANLILKKIKQDGKVVQSGYARAAGHTITFTYEGEYLIVLELSDESGNEIDVTASIIKPSESSDTNVNKKNSSDENASKKGTSQEVKSCGAELDNSVSTQLSDNQGSNTSAGDNSGEATYHEQAVTQGQIVYWTRSGKSYHSTPACKSLSRSVLISGALDEAIAHGKSDPCDNCVRQ